jgi:hypothetical protein
MLFVRITRPASITLENHKDVRKFWSIYGPDAIIGYITVRTPLTAAQYRKLPAELRSRIAPEVSA